MDLYMDNKTKKQIHSLKRISIVELWEYFMIDH